MLYLLIFAAAEAVIVAEAVAGTVAAVTSETDVEGVAAAIIGIAAAAEVTSECFCNL